MEAGWLASMMIHPVGVGLLFAVVLLSAATFYLRDEKAPIEPGRLAAGYAGAVLVCVGIAAASSYVPQEEALTKWHVLPGDYWTVALKRFLMEAMLLIYLAVLGIAVVGAPVVFAMARRGWGTVPGVLVASLSISLIFLLVLELLDQSPNSHFVRNAPALMGAHLLLALGFCIGARLPWKRTIHLQGNRP